jgi:cell division protein FtsN
MPAAASGEASNPAPNPALNPTRGVADGAAPAAGPVPARLAYATAADSASEPYVLQFGAFRQQKDAKDLQARLLQKGIPAVIVTKVGSEDNLTWQTVRYGGYKDVSTALKAASEYEKQGFLAFVRPVDSI